MAALLFFPYMGGFLVLERVLSAQGVCKMCKHELLREVCELQTLMEEMFGIETDRWGEPDEPDEDEMRSPSA